MRVSVERPVKPETGLRAWRVIFATTILLQMQDVLTSLAGWDAQYVTYATSATFVSVAIMALGVQVVRTKALKGWYNVPWLAFGTFVLVTFVANSIIYGISANSWLLSLYKYTPILLLYTLAILGTRLTEILAAIVISSLIVAILTSSDSIVGTSFMAQFERGTVLETSVERIVVFKNEMVLSITVLTAFILRRWKADSLNALALACVVVIGFSLFIVQQSRLASLAALIGLLSVVLLSGRFRFKNTGVIVAALLISVPALGYAVAPYVQSLIGLDLEDQGNKMNIAVRAQTVEYYWARFVETGGIGFGAVSNSRLGHPVTEGLSIHLNIEDAGAYQALFQFGILGAFLSLTVTFSILVLAWRCVRGGNEAARVAGLAVFGFLIGFTVSPFPLSFFTQAWTIQTGGALLFIAWKLSRVRRRDLVFNFPPVLRRVSLIDPPNAGPLEGGASGHSKVGGLVMPR